MFTRLYVVVLNLPVGLRNKISMKSYIRKFDLNFSNLVCMYKRIMDTYGSKLSS
jgi:hypothetical protein